MNKKVVVIGLLALGAFLFFGKAKANAATPNQLPMESFSFGLNSDGTVRQLTDLEAQKYLDTQTDLFAAFGNNLEKAKEHWFFQGYKENRIV